MSDPSRLARLHAVKLAALVRDHGVTADPQPHDFPGGAALTIGDASQEAWVLLADRTGRGLGGAVAWALRRDVGRLHVVADDGTGTLARRAAGFALPISVWLVDGRTLRPASPDALPEPPQVPSAHLEFEAVIRAAGATPVVEHGVLSGEVAGLEVCRVVDDPFTGAVRLEVGVGAHDREAFLMLHGDRPTAPALADVVRSVAEHRGRDVQGHPLARLAKERLLRDRLVASPHLVGATSVVVTAPPVPRPNLKDVVPCAAVATIAGTRVAVVCTAGVDLEAVPWAVDARVALGLDRCLLVLPARDALDVQRRLAAAATPPIEVVTVTGDVLTGDIPTGPAPASGAAPVA